MVVGENISIVLVPLIVFRQIKLPDGIDSVVELFIPVYIPSAIWKMYAKGIFVCSNFGTFRNPSKLVEEASVPSPIVAMKNWS